MGMINWLFFRKTTVISIKLPTALHHALETATYMQNNARDEDDQIERDDIVAFALAKYLQENLWTNVVDDFQVVTRIKSHEAPFIEQRRR